MKRDISHLKNEIFDVLIIGAGIHGATIAWVLSHLGYKIALIDSSDFGSVTSANSLKIIHGGLRYLQHADLKRIRESIISRKIFQRLAPYCVKNIPCLIPTKGFGFRSKLALYSAMKLYDLITFDKNWLLDEDQKISKGFMISKKKFRSIVPDFNGEDVTGGAVWYETLAENSERLGLEFIHSAYQHGCVVGNYVNALKINHAQKIVQGIIAEDIITGEEFEIKSKIIINSTGPFINNLLKDINNPKKRKEVPLCKAINVLVNKKLFGDYAVGLEGTHDFKDKDSLIKHGKRFFFFVPWKNRTMIGTTYVNYDGDPSNLKVESKDLREILEEINLIYPSANLKIENVTFHHAGVLPKDDNQKEVSGEVQPAKKSYILDELNHSGIKGLYSILSVKYTTAPYIALELGKFLRRMHPEIKVKVERLSFPKEENLNSSRNALYRKYGKHSETIEYFERQDVALKEKISTDSEITEAEIKYFVENECALRLEDVVFRRTDICSYEFCGIDLLEKVAQKMSNYLHWNENQTKTEIENVINKYSPLQIRKLSSVRNL